MDSGPGKYRDDLAMAVAGDPLDRAPVRWRRGVVVAVGAGTVTVTVGGSLVAVPGVRYLGWYTPVVNDVVEILQHGGALIVLGPLAPIP